jgi:hypothetical protein
MNFDFGGKLTFGGNVLGGKVRRGTHSGEMSAGEMSATFSTSRGRRPIDCRSLDCSHIFARFCLLYSQSWTQCCQMAWIYTKLLVFSWFFFSSNHAACTYSCILRFWENFNDSPKKSVFKRKKKKRKKEKILHPVVASFSRSLRKPSYPRIVF